MKNLKGIALITSYPPRECGIAQFSSDLKKALKKIKRNLKIKVFAINEPKAERKYPKEVIFQISQEKKKDYQKAAQIINNDPEISGVNLQHVFSLFGGKHGSFVLDFLSALKKPCVTTFHMVYPKGKKPSKYEIVEKDFPLLTEKICFFSKKVVVLTKNSKKILKEQYKINPQKIAFIPHGVWKIKLKKNLSFKKRFVPKSEKIILTFGLLRPKKGIEYLIQAMPFLLKKNKNFSLLVVGENHPQRDPKYLDFLKNMAKKIHLFNKKIFFVEKFLSFKKLVEYILVADALCFPYLSKEQVSSGTILLGMSCKKLIFSTPFLFAKEFLSPKRGVFIKYKDPQDIAKKILFYFSHPEEKKERELNAFLFSKDFLWEKIAQKYLKVFKKAF